MKDVKIHVPDRADIMQLVWSLNIPRRVTVRTDLREIRFLDAHHLYNVRKNLC